MNTIIQNFDRSVRGYGAHSVPQNALATALARWVIPEERNGYAIEFGAGTGVFTRKLQPWSGPYLATDAAPRMVQAGMEQCPIVAWKEQTADHPQYLGPADWIFACNLLQWVPKPTEVLTAWRETLKPDGRLVIAVLLPGTFAELRQVLPEANPLIWRSVTEWAKVLGSAGFVLEREEIWEHTHIYPNALAFLRAIHAMGLAPSQTIGPGRLRTAIREYDRQFTGLTGVRSTWQAWLVRAMVA